MICTTGESPARQGDEDGLSEKVVFEQRPKGRISGGRAFQAPGTETREAGAE